MLLDAASAKALAVIVLVSTQGVNQLNPQLPLQATDRGDNWLIKGTPYTDRAEGLQNCFFHISFKKDTAEVISIGFEGRMILTDEERQHWAKSLSPAEFQRIFGLRTEFRPGGDELARNLAMNAALYGGLINKSDDAIDYARVLMRGSPALAYLKHATLYAEDRSDIWYIFTRKAGDAKPVDVMSFSRENGKVLSGHM